MPEGKPYDRNDFIFNSLARHRHRYEVFRDFVTLQIVGQYEKLELGNDNNGQFFTPPEISLMMAKMTYGDQLEKLDQPFNYSV